MTSSELQSDRWIGVEWGWEERQEAERVALWVIQIREDGSLVYSGEDRDGEIEFGR